MIFLPEVLELIDCKSVVHHARSQPNGFAIRIDIMIRRQVGQMCAHSAFPTIISVPLDQTLCVNDLRPVNYIWPSQMRTL